MDFRDDLELLTSPDDWQASSHPTLCETAPEAIFEPYFL